jgi:hypothetical protein
VVLDHGLVRIVGDGENVRRAVLATLPTVHVDDGIRVDGKPAVRVDDHAEQTRVRLQTSR